MARTIQSPGVETREVDFTLRPAVNTGTGVFITGFANQGPIDEILQPTTISEFEQIFGTPTNAAERYFYHTAKAALQAPVQLKVTRLPYGLDKGEGFATWKYSALVYPVRAVTRVETVTAAATPQIVTAAVTLVPLDNGSSVASSLSGGGFTVSLVSGLTYDIGFNVNSTGAKGHNVTGATVVSIPVNDADNTTAIGASIANTLNTTAGLQAAVTYTAGTSTYSITVTNVVSGVVATTSTGYSTVSAIAFAITRTNGINALSGVVDTPTKNLSAATAYFLGSPTHLNLSLDQYEEIRNNNIVWSNYPTVTGVNSAFNYNTLSDAGVVIINRSQTAVNNRFEGYYVGLTDNNNNNPATLFDGLLGVNGITTGDVSINSYTTIPRARLNFALSATKAGDGTSVSEVMENLSEFDLSQSSFRDTVSLGLFKLRQSVFSPDAIALDYVLSESYVGSLDYHRQIQSSEGGSGVSFYLGSSLASSPNISLLVNPYISNRYTNSWLGTNGIPTKAVRMLTRQLATPFNVPGFVDNNNSYTTRVGANSALVNTLLQESGSTDSLFPVGIYTDTVSQNKDIGNLPAKLSRAFELVENSDLVPFTIACEAGLGTINVNVTETAFEQNKPLSACGQYIESQPLNALSAFYVTNSEQLDEAGARLRSAYNNVANIFIEQAQNQRKDFIVVLDPIRNIFVQGDNNKIINTQNQWGPKAGIGNNPDADGYVATNFSQHIYWPLRHQFSLLNTSYACTYSTWAQTVDNTSNRQVWVPFSGFAAGIFGNTDSNFQPWFAPAGFTRGTVGGITDIGVYPKQKQRDQLYKISVNPVAFFPAEGNVIYGQKTLLKKPSAFDRINVRRLFIDLEVATRDTVKFYIFEPNTLFTRTQVINTLTPIFENAKNTEGLYDYLIICDERNNTPDVIDQNELKVDIYLKPVRTAEFVLVSFYATRTGQDFTELVT